MANYTVSNIRFIPSINGKAPAMAIDVVGFPSKKGIYRSEKVALIDLAQNGVAVSSLSDLSAKDQFELRHRFDGAKISGDVTFVRAGSTYIADENSSAVKSGEVEVGATLKRKKDQFVVEGFLTLTMTANRQTIEVVADRVAEAFAMFRGDTGTSSAPAVAPAPEQKTIELSVPEEEEEQEDVNAPEKEKTQSVRGTSRRKPSNK